MWNCSLKIQSGCVEEITALVHISRSRREEQPRRDSSVVISRKCLLNVWSGEVIGGVDGIKAEIQIITSDLKEIQLNKSATAAAAVHVHSLTHGDFFACWPCKFPVFWICNHYSLVLLEIKSNEWWTESNKSAGPAAAVISYKIMAVVSLALKIFEREIFAQVLSFVKWTWWCLLQNDPLLNVWL